MNEEKEESLEELQKKRANRKIFLFSIFGMIVIVLAILAILSYAYFTRNPYIPPVNLTNNNPGNIETPNNSLPAANTTGINGTTPATNKTTNQTKTKPSSGDGGGGGGGNPQCSPSKDCAYYYGLNQCGFSLDDGCSNIIDCTSCINGTCSNGSCVASPSCISDDNCTSLSGECKTGKCNPTSKICYADFVSDGSNCSLGMCHQGNCVECITNDNCSVDETCVNGNCLVGECEQDSDCTYRGPGFICNATSSRCEWLPPIGIPRPTFGIEETYRMYDEPANRNSALNYTQNSEGGFYTHYIDASDPNATEEDNPYGSPNKPRHAPPMILPAGSVVEIHHDSWINNDPDNALFIYSQATREHPTFVRGVGMPRLSLVYPQGIGINGPSSYLIVEGLSVPGAGVGDYGGSVDHVAFRNIEVMIGAGALSASTYHGGNLSDIVFYNCSVHDLGNWDNATTDEDIGGVKVGGAITRLWLLDSEMYHNSYSGIQIEGGRYIYAGRNVAHDNRQAGFWSKRAEDVIFSQNIAYNHGYPKDADQGGFGFQYDPMRVWIIFNTAYSNKFGIISGSGGSGPLPTGPPRDEFYMIGNRIFDSKSTGILLNGLNPASGPAQVIGNTIYGAMGGCVGNAYYKTNMNIVDNIFSNCSPQVALASEYGSQATMNYNLFQGPINILSYTNLSQLQATGQCLGCKEGNPQFVDAANNNFNLLPTSPAIDSGATLAAYQRFYDLYGIDIRKDIEGRARPIDGDGNGSAEWDIGAYEYNGVIGGSSAQAETESLPSEKASLSLLSQIYKFFKGFLTANTIKEIQRIKNSLSV